MSQVKRIVVGGLVAAALLQGGCSGCDEQYKCDNTGCYWCDSYGCRSVDVPTRADCTHGDWECPADRPLCTADGYCVAECSADADCPAGLRCAGNLCVEPTTVVECTTDAGCTGDLHCVDGACVPELHPGTACGESGDVCTGGDVCAPSGCCLPPGGAACCTDVDCGAGQTCDGTAHLCSNAPAPECHVNADCPAHYLCIDAVCKLPCSSSAECGIGCSCVGGFCTSPAS